MNKKDFFSAITIIVSIIAIIISIRSCQVANKSLELSQKQYSDKFKTIWKFEYLEQKQVFKIEPTNKDVILQKGIVFYPDTISKYDWEIRFPESYLHVTSPKSNIETFVSALVQPKKDHSIILDNGKIPVILETYYSLNGDNFHEVSLYMLQYMAQVDDNPYSLPTISILGLTFAERLDVNIDKKGFLEELWNNSELTEFEK